MSQDIGPERRLAAVLAADVAGFSRLTETDEIGTLRMLAAQRAILDSAIARHRGRIANTAGDSVLAEFPSAVNAVQCAVEAQQTLHDAVEDVPAERRVLFRIGIHVGDVLVRDGDLLGSGVNVAARLEALADAGGIVLSASTHDQVKKILVLPYTDLGLQNVKNIAEPVRAFAIGPTSVATMAASSGGMSLPLPDKPSIAVLPFQNMSGDPEQEYFADGMAEDIITALSRFRSLFVIARNSSFTYKGRTVDIKQVGRELGVRYVLEGSVRRASGNLRVTGQLIEAATNKHIWADKYDGPLQDVFELQDQVTCSVVGSISPKILQAEIERANRKSTASLGAYDCYLRGYEHFRLETKEGYEAAFDFFQQAIALDPKFATPYGLAARTFSRRLADGLIDNRIEAIRKGEAYARKAIELGQDDEIALCHAAMFVAVYLRDPEWASNLLDQAGELNPNLLTYWNVRGWVSLQLGKPDEAIDQLQNAIRLSPLDPMIHGTFGLMAESHLLKREFHEALAWAARALARRPNHVVTLRVAIAANTLLGRLETARRIIDSNPKLIGESTISEMMSHYVHRRTADLELYREVFKRLGMPE